MGYAISREYSMFACICVCVCVPRGETKESEYRVPTGGWCVRILMLGEWVYVAEAMGERVRRTGECRGMDRCRGRARKSDWYFGGEREVAR